MLQTVEPVDSLPNPAKELASLKNMSFDDLIQTLVKDVVHFAISIVLAIVVFYVGKWIIGQIYRVVDSILRRRNVEASLTTFVLSFVKIVLYFILIVAVIGILGLETSSFLAIFASAGVAVGMALSGTLQNFAGGVLILMLKPFKVGDYIEAQGYAGTVKKIEIFNTVITTPDNKTIIIPNGGLSTGSINNWSRAATRRVSWEIALAYGTDVAAVREFILNLVRADERVIKGQYVTFDPAAPNKSLLIKDNAPDLSPTVVLSSLADSSIQVQVRAWTETANYWNLFYEINERLYTELPQAGFSFPFPQLDVHLSHQQPSE